GQDVPVSFVVRSGRAVTVTSLTVKAVADPTLVDATIQSNADTINENRAGQGALVIANPHDRPLRIVAVHVAAPTAVGVTLTCPAAAHIKLTTPGGATKTFRSCPLTIGPRSLAVLPLVLDAGDAVAPGPRTLLVTVDARARNPTVS